MLRDSRVNEAVLAKVGFEALAGSTKSFPELIAALVSAFLENPGALRARYELLLEATRRPSLEAEAQRWRAQFVSTSELALTAAGQPAHCRCAPCCVHRRTGLRHAHHGSNQHTRARRTRGRGHPARLNGYHLSSEAVRCPNTRMHCPGGCCAHQPPERNYAR